METSTPIHFDGRIDQFLDDARLLLRSDSDPQAREWYIWVLNAQTDRDIDRKHYKRPRAPLAWMPTMLDIAAWIGWK